MHALLKKWRAGRTPETTPETRTRRTLSTVSGEIWHTTPRGLQSHRTTRIYANMTPDAAAAEYIREHRRAAYVDILDVRTITL